MWEVEGRPCREPGTICTLYVSFFVYNRLLFQTYIWRTTSKGIRERPVVHSRAWCTQSENNIHATVDQRTMVMCAQAASYRTGGLGAQATIRSAWQALWFQLQGDNTGLPVLLGCPHEHYGEACRRPPWPADFLLPFEAGDWILQSALVTPNFVQSSSRDFQRITYRQKHDISKLQTKQLKNSLKGA